MHGKNEGGPVNEENSSLSCEKCEIERKTTNGICGWCEKKLNERGMSVKQERMIVLERSEWRAVVNA